MAEQFGPRIEKRYAWVAEDADGETIIGVHIASSGQWLQLAGADGAAIERHRSSADKAAKVRVCKVRLRMFNGAVVIDEV
jgi:hypothetical protein